MKASLLALIFFLITSFSFAQFNPDLIAQSLYSQKPSSLFNPSASSVKMEWLPPGYRMRKVGATLTLGGAFLIGGGLIVYTSSGTKGDRPYPENFIGPLMIIHGTAMAVPGVIFWTKGTTKYKIYKAEQEKTTASLSFTGNGFAYRF